MNEEERRMLVEGYRQVLTWDDERVTLGGWANPDYCSIVCNKPGFWRTSWDAVARAAISGTFDQEILWAGNGAWLGLPKTRPGYPTTSRPAQPRPAKPQKEL